MDNIFSPFLTAEDVIARIKRMVESFPTAKDFAITYGLSEPYVHDLVNGRRLPGKKALKALGLKKVVYFVREERD